MFYYFYGYIERYYRAVQRDESILFSTGANTVIGYCNFNRPPPPPQSMNSLFYRCFS